MYRTNKQTEVRGCRHPAGFAAFFDVSTSFLLPPHLARGVSAILRSTKLVSSEQAKLLWYTSFEFSRQPKTYFSEIAGTYIYTITINIRFLLVRPQFQIRKTHTSGRETYMMLFRSRCVVQIFKKAEEQQ